MSCDGVDELVTDLIQPGHKTICSARVNLELNNNGRYTRTIKAKLDSCGSVSIAHENLMNEIKPAGKYQLPPIRLRGIGGRTNLLNKVGILRIKQPQDKHCDLLCYVFNEAIGQTEEMLLISMSAIIEARINILHHMSKSNNDECTELQFWPDNKSFDEVCMDMTVSDEVHKVLKHKGNINPRDIYLSADEFEEVESDKLVNLLIGHIETGTTVIEEAYMTEIQLRRIVDRTAQEASEQQSDGDERMVKDGEDISKFSKEAMTLGDDVYEANKTAPLILRKVYLLYDRYVGEDKVFPIKNGAPRIMTKYKDVPYTYELQPEYAAGNKKFPCVKAMDWTGKTASAQVIRGFVKSTPVVEQCALPRCISRLVIAPKYAPGQMKDDPDHGFRVCVNALINKCLKPYASTVPLATDEIKKLYGFNYYLQADGFSAYWSIPVCEESKRLTAFHTPDGIYCWNRLMMGAVPASAVQQTAYLEALDQFIDYDEDDNLRKCLVDNNGERLKDKEGNPKTLRHRFAIYCDDIAAGADTLEELYELLEGLICCCNRAGIQIKAGKLKFGVPKVVFHNYTISKGGTEPKEANICSFINMQEPKDIHQLRAFLGCCQQLNQYIKDYGIIAKPLHNITKKGVKGPPPWIKGSEYDIAFHKLKAIIANSKLYLHHKDALRRLFLEVDASDVGWGACAYQMLKAYVGDPGDEGRMRIGDTGPRQIIQWISKAWTTHELTLPVFYRESLARILALEKFRNLIETNIEAGITLYTDHKPALFENSLSNKGQLSAWKLAEVADLLSIVENLYRQGGKMLFADPLSRVCGPTEGWYDASLPRKLAALFEHLPEEVRNNVNMRVYAGKDTYAAGRLVQKWRKPSNPISQGKLLTKELAPTAFHIGVDDVNKSVNEVVKLIKGDKSFAVLMPISVTSEIARLENVDGERCHDLELAKKVSVMSKITLASSAEVWLINLPGEPFNHFYSNDMEGLGLTGVQEVFLASFEEIRNESKTLVDESEEDLPISTVMMD